MTYTKPELKVLGSVADLTQTGNSQGTYNGANAWDAKGGSRPSNGN